MDELCAFGVPIEGLHTETGPGVFEAAILYSDALEAADRAVLFKTGAQEIGYRFGIMPSFMAKWNAQLPGCSGTSHQSLCERRRTKNLFHDEKDPHRMSPLFKSYLAGQMRCLPEILPFFAPNVNSYKRLVDGFWAPTKPTWGIDNRTVAFRVIPGSPKSTRVETRVPARTSTLISRWRRRSRADFTASRKTCTLTATPVVGSAYQDEDALRVAAHLARGDAHALSESKIAREIFGDAFVDHFVAHARMGMAAVPGLGDRTGNSSVTSKSSRQDKT